MAFIRKLKVWLMVAALPLMAFHCNPTNPPEPSIPIYSYRDTIINPPDDFKIAFDIQQTGDRHAYVLFATDAVWKITNTGDSRAIFYIQNSEGEKNAIPSTFTAGLKAGKVYIFGANNNNYTDINQFFCRVTKQADDYQTYPIKF